MELLRILGRTSPKRLSSLTPEELKAFKPTEFKLKPEVKPVFVLEKKPDKTERKLHSSPKEKKASKPPNPELKKPDTNEVRLKKFGGEEFLEYIKSLEQEAEREIEEAKREFEEAKSEPEKGKKEKEKLEKKEKIKSRINYLKENIFEIQNTEITFFKQVLLVLEVLKVIEVYPGLDPGLRKRLSEYKKNVIILINSIGLHKDINKAFFTTLDTILDSTEKLEAKKRELIEIFSNLIDKFQVTEMPEIDNIMKIYGYYSIKNLTLSDIVVSGYNPSMTGHVNANSCFTIFNARMLRYKSLYESLKENMEKPEIPKPSFNISENVEKMYNFTKSLAVEVNKNAKENEAEVAREAKEAAAAQVAEGAEAAATKAAPPLPAAPPATPRPKMPLLTEHINPDEEEEVQIHPNPLYGTQNNPGPPEPTYAEIDEPLKPPGNYNIVNGNSGDLQDERLKHNLQKAEQERMLKEQQAAAAAEAAAARVAAEEAKAAKPELYVNMGGLAAETPAAPAAALPAAAQAAQTAASPPPASPPPPATEPPAEGAASPPAAAPAAAQASSRNPNKAGETDANGYNDKYATTVFSSPD